MGTARDFIRLLRPSQWYKNFIVPAVGVFAIQVFDLMIYIYLILAFIIACGISSVNYIINDIMDVESDQVHPEKKSRPIASGNISKRTAALIALTILVIAISCSFILSFLFAVAMLAFFGVAQLYNFVLKKYIFVDVLTISINFIVRGAAGLAIIITYSGFDLFPTMWAIWAVFIFALLLAISKRKVDLQLVEEAEKVNHKKVYEKYSKQLLDHLVVMISTILLMGYYMFILFNDTSGGYLLITVPVATYLMFRYLFLLFSSDKHMGTPEKAIKDLGILISSILVLLLFLLVRYLEGFGII